MNTYYNDPRIKAYVNKFCIKENMSVQEALNTAIVKNYIEYISTQEHETKLPNMWGSAGAPHENMAEI